jgi:hypothetical protein
MQKKLLTKQTPCGRMNFADTPKGDVIIALASVGESPKIKGLQKKEP